MRRLRECPDELEMRELYSQSYNHERWEDHIERVQWTMKIINNFAETSNIDFAFDPACGDGAILRSLSDDIVKKYGDFVMAPHLDVVGPLEKTIPRGSGGFESLIILTEIIEHVCDPEQVLRLAKVANFDFLLLTTPINEVQEIHDNPQHVWAWSEDEMNALLRRTGWNPLFRNRLNTFWYDYQLWICSSI